MKKSEFTGIKAYENLTFSDNFMFCEIMRSNPELCKEVIEAILDIKIREIIKIGDEETVKVGPDGHGVRLDVYLEGDDAIYDIEMQTRNEGNLPKRSRYYQGILDTDFLKAGDDYNKLKRTYVIFICTFDLFGLGLPKYTFDNTCIEAPHLILNDDATKVFLNAAGHLDGASSKLAEFLQYIHDGRISGTLSSLIENDLNAALRDQGRRSRYMTFEWELARVRREGKEEGIAQGLSEGIAQGSLGAIKKILTRLSPSEIIDMGFSEEEVKKAQEELTLQ